MNLRPRRHDRVVPIIVRGASFTFRTFHADDGWSRMPLAYCPDRLVTMTLPAIPGLRHYEPATREVVL